MPPPLPPPPPPHRLHLPPLQLARFAALQPGLDERFAALRDSPEDATLDDALDALYEARALVVLDGHDGALDAPGAPANVSQKGDHRRRALSLDELNEIALGMDDPRQCGRCGFGPVDHRGCSDLRAHHMEVSVS